MNNTICLDENYSTTRLLVQEKPEIVNKAEDKFDSILFLPEGERRKGEGGLRTQGYFKNSYDDKPLISIITVVWNDAKGLEKTIQSIIHQIYENVEFIVIDGGSTDETTDVIKKYEEHIDYWVSEKDNGIYDAMNKGIHTSTGSWLNFMNAGDTFINEHILKKVKFENFDDKVLLYGQKIYNDKVIEPLPIQKLKLGVIHANHQSMFFNKKLLGDELVYDLQYKIYGDYELVNKIYLHYPKLITYIDIIIADFEGGGVSSVPSAQKRKDKYKILYRYYGLIGLFKALLYRGKVFLERLNK